MATIRENYDNMMRAKNWTAATQTTYRSGLNKFLSIYSNPSKLTTEEIIKYIASQPSRASMAQTYGILKNLYRHVLKQDRKFGFVPFPKKEHKIPKEIPHEEVVERINKVKNTKHRLMLTMLYGTGMRVSELANSRWSDIQRTGKDNNPLKLLINGKGNVQRSVPLSRHIFDLLFKYCKEYNLNCKNSDDQIFGEDYTVKSVQIICKKFMDCTPHQLRHLYAQWLVDNGTELETVRQLLGHRSLATVQIYARTRHEKIDTPV